MKRQTREERKTLRQEIRSAKRKEHILSQRNDLGFKNLTPYNAVRELRGEEIVYK